MRLEQLKYLVEVANCKSINKAAQNLYLTQPALSMAINALEEELQCALFKRTKRGVTLTDNGQRVLREAEEILDTIQGWYLLDQQRERVLEGVVHILAIPSVCISFTDTLIGELQKKYPRLSIFIHDETPQHMLTALANGAVNIGLTSCAKHMEEKFCRRVRESQWLSEKLLEDERCVLLSTANPLASQEALMTKDLQQLTLAYYSDLSDEISESYKKYFNSERFFRLSNRESIFQLVAQDGAVGIFPEKMTRTSYFRQHGLIKAVPIADLDMRTSYWLLHPQEKLMSINEIHMMQIIIERFAACIEQLKP